MKVSILAAALGIATLSATPLFAQSATPGSSGQGSETTESPSMGSGHSSGMSHEKNRRDMKGMSHQRKSWSSKSARLSERTVKEIQQKLQQEGLNVGTVDGKLGPKTRSAVKEFQQKKGMKATGRIDHQTLAALGVEANGGHSGSSGSHMRGTGHGSSSGSGNESGASPSSPKM